MPKRKGSKKSKSKSNKAQIKREEEIDVNMENENNNEENADNSMSDNEQHNVNENENGNENGNENENEDDNDNLDENEDNNEDADNNDGNNDENDDNNDNDDNEDNDENEDNNGNENEQSSNPVRRGRGRPPSGASGSNGGNSANKKGRGGRRTKARDNRYRVYIFKVLQQVHPKVGITKTAMDIVNSFIEDMFDQICNEAMKLCHYHKSHTIGAREIATAAKLILPGELRKHAIMEGDKAVKIFVRKQKDLVARRKVLRGNEKGVFRGRRKNQEKQQ